MTDGMMESVSAIVLRWQEERSSFHRDAMVEVVEDFEQWRRMDTAIYLRDLDGTGSMHVCAKGDPGAIRYVRAGE